MPVMQTKAVKEVGLTPRYVSTNQIPHPESSNESAWSRLGERWGKWIAKNTPPDKRQKVFATVESLGSTQVTLPDSQRQYFGKRYTEDTIDQAADEAKKAMSVLNTDNLWGSYIYDLDLFREEISQQLGSIEDEKTGELLEEWTRRLRNIREDRSRVGTVIIPVWRQFGNLANLTKPSLITASILLRKLGRFSPLNTPSEYVSNKVMDSAAKLQLTMDIVNTADPESSLDEQQKIATKIGERYGLDPNKLSKIGHPDFLKRIGASLALQEAIYTWPRLVGGYAVFLAAWFSPEFRDLVDSNYGLATAASAGVLAGSALVRACVDYAVLKKHNFSPDIVESAVGLLNGSIDDQKKLRIDPRAALIGPTLDIAVSSFAPPFNAAWTLGLPYTVPAYLIAMAADQWIFFTTNILWSKSMSAIKKEGK